LSEKLLTGGHNKCNLQSVHDDHQELALEVGGGERSAKQSKEVFETKDEPMTTSLSWDNGRSWPRPEVEGC
jgi:hypothetical protein